MSFNSPSKGEKKIIDLLRTNKIKFEREVSFDGLVGLKGVPLRFDFAVYRNNKLYCLIDFDGRQHFEFVKYFHKNICNFNKAKEWDRRKNSYCLIHNIPLIRIPYWELDTLTFERIFTCPGFRVTNKYHNDYLIQRRC